MLIVPNYSKIMLSIFSSGLKTSSFEVSKRALLLRGGPCDYLKMRTFTSFVSMLFFHLFLLNCSPISCNTGALLYIDLRMSTLAVSTFSYVRFL